MDYAEPAWSQKIIQRKRQQYEMESCISSCGGPNLTIIWRAVPYMESKVWSYGEPCLIIWRAVSYQACIKPVLQLHFLQIDACVTTHVNKPEHWAVEILLVLPPTLTSLNNEQFDVMHSDLWIRASTSVVFEQSEDHSLSKTVDQVRQVLVRSKQ